MAEGRGSIKRNSASTWRDRLRDDCRRRAQQQRHETLGRYRASSLSPQQLQSLVQRDVRQAVRCEVERQTQGSQDGLTDPGFPSHEPGEVARLLEDDLQLEAFLAEVEAQLYVDIAEELAALEAAEVAEAASAMSALQGGSTPGRLQGPRLLCPLCQAAHLGQLHGVVLCRGCGLRLNLAAEGISLTDLQARLAQVYEEHALSGCTGRLRCQVEDLFGSAPSLTASCETCHALHIVV